MKLVIAGRYPLNPEKIEGGVEAYISNLVKGLQKLQIPNLEIHVIACREDIDSNKVIEKNGITIWFLPSASLKRFGNITFGIIDRYKIKKKIKKLKPDIIHAHGTGSYAAAALEAGYPTLLTVHGILFKEVKLVKKGVLNWIREFPVTYLERICLKKARDIICDAPYVKDAIKSLTNSKISIVKPPIDDRYFELENKEILNRIIFVGSIERRKRLLDLLKAVCIIKKQIPKIELRIIGSTNTEDYFKILKQYVKDNELEENVMFLGHILEGQLFKEYSTCCLLVLPSSEESAGMVIQQAMAVGKAVVASRVAGIPYFVRDGETGFLVDCGDIKYLAKKIKLVLSNKDLRGKLGENAKREALKRFKAEKVAQETYEAYKQILKIK